MPYAFSRDGAKRIVDAVRAVERRGDVLTPRYIGKSGGSSGWSGVAIVQGNRYYDPDLTSDTTGTAIVDNYDDSTKPRLIKIEKVNNDTIVVSYENGPLVFPFALNVEWYEVSKAPRVIVIPYMRYICG